MAKLSKFITITGFIILSEVVYYFYRSIPRYFTSHVTKDSDLICWLKKQSSNDNTGACYQKVIFFPDPGMTCARVMSERTCRDPNCTAVHNFTSLALIIKMIENAKTSVTVCIYLFTSGVLGDALVKCHKKGVLVRVITDDRNSGENGEVTNAQIGKLRRNGIAVCCYASSFWMHHKFMIIDDEIVMSGSFNWTNAAAMGNSENCIITSDKNIVTDFNNEFSKLWSSLQPAIFKNIDA